MRDSPSWASGAGSATATGWVPATASFQTLIQAEPRRSRSWQPPPTSLLLSAALSFSPSGAPPPPPRDWPRDPATGSTRFGGSRSARGPGFPRVGWGRHAGQSRPLRGGAAQARPPADARLRWVPPRGPAAPGRSARGRVSPAAGWARGQALRAGTAPLAHLGAPGCFLQDLGPAAQVDTTVRFPSVCVFTCHTLLARIRFRLHAGEPTMCPAPRATGTRSSTVVSAVRSSLLLC